ncbi:hypothetical protein [Pontiella agarivorans]|uniref:Abortive infection protein-like C-terminal domain-containing protein n=1 Tax=Pontiella agarivorans TaxID=3038953 RepID=A0ABU5MVS5_9BACT|nr:hypothetical protein [Pontiella agarivorans]MDZ8118186.1 hypothetical protein [Pontiella agarivorans]
MIEAEKNEFKKFLFREDSFDPVSMVRRGRIYQPYPEQPNECRVAAIDAYDGLIAHQYASAVIKKRLHTYQPYALSLNGPDQKYAIIGTQSAYSLWRIVSNDRMYLNDELLTLRPLHSMGALPDLDLREVSDPWKTKVEETVNKVVDAMTFANADSIIELCRHAASAALFAHFHEDIKNLAGTDLGPLAKRAGDEGLHIVAHCGHLIAKFHSRIKPNNQVHFESRPPTDRDAELAIYSLSCILSDLKLTPENQGYFPHEPKH